MWFFLAKKKKFLDEIPLYSFFGIGKKTYERLSQLGYTKGSELRKAEESFLVGEFGKMGAVFYRMARGLMTEKSFLFVIPNRLVSKQPFPMIRKILLICYSL